MAHSFVAYIDESGDDGIKNFRTVGTGGTSQWLVISCCLISSGNDRLVPKWRDSITNKFPAKKRRDLHFAHLDHGQRVTACQTLSRLPLRAFSVMSNKTTIPNHPRPDLFRKKNTLYWYLARYLIERISIYCERRYRDSLDGDGTVRIVFSRRGGMNYSDFRTYLNKLKSQQTNPNFDLSGDQMQIYWPAIDIEAVDALGHKNRAGL